MLNYQSLITKLVSDVCPIDGISFGDLSDKQTWRIDFKAAATAQQRQDARNVITNFVENPTDLRNYSNRLHYQNEPIYKYQYRVYVQTNPGSTFNDFINFLET